MIHDEMHGRSSGPASKTFTDILGWRNIKRGRFIRMKRTQSNITCSPLTQRDKLGNHLQNIGSLQNLIYRRLIDHLSLHFLSKYKDRCICTMYHTEPTYKMMD